MRLAWHAAGTYNKADGSGGSNGATMRFAPEVRFRRARLPRRRRALRHGRRCALRPPPSSTRPPPSLPPSAASPTQSPQSEHGANAGLGAARARLAKVAKNFPAISTSDLWSLAGVVALQEMGGPTIPWRAGRSDAASGAACTPDGRLPDASKKAPHLREIFGRMGFSDAEIVALSGAHSLGRCHPTSSGFTGPWTFAPTTLSNDYFKRLLEETWVEKKWAGPRQFEDAKTRALMMLPSDLALIEDRAMRAHVEAFACDQDKFFAAFAAAFVKLGELGVKFAPGAAPMTFKRA